MGDAAVEFRSRVSLGQLKGAGSRQQLEAYGASFVRLEKGLEVYEHPDLPALELHVKLVGGGRIEYSHIYSTSG